MLYIIRTNSLARGFNIGITGRKEGSYTKVLRGNYEGAATAIQPPPNATGLIAQCRLTTPIKDDGFPQEMKLEAVNRGEAPDLNLLRDFWTTLPIPVASQKFRDLIESLDPNVHQFIEFKLYNAYTDEPIDHSRFYFFVCGRLLDIRPYSESLKKEMCDLIVTDGTNDLRTIAEEPGLQKYIEKLPIWRTLEDRSKYFANKTFIKEAQNRGLMGFKETKKLDEIVYGDVYHVWY